MSLFRDGLNPKRRSIPGAALVLPAAVALMFMIRCSDDGDPPPADTGPVVDFLNTDAKLWPCTTPGMSCNAHNACALNAICGKDNLCHPSGFQDCNDGLDCTDDGCKAMGLCDNVPRTNYCALPVKGATDTEIKCFKAQQVNAKDPCLVCDPATDKKHWSPKNGGSCDDGDSCTKDDYCQNGTCQGISYKSKCADGYSCTEDRCDGKGGCLAPKLKSDYCQIYGTCHKNGKVNTNVICYVCDVKKDQSNWSTLTDACKINGVCYKTGDKHVGGCAQCDTKISKSAWVVKVNTHCLINNLCLKSGTVDTAGCGVCDPTKNPYGYTPLASLCKIGVKCYKKGELDYTGCGECQPAVNAKDWTPVSGKCLIGGACLTSGGLDATGCLKCDPATSSSAWTPVAGKCLIEGTCYKDSDKSPAGCGVCDSKKSASWWSVTAGAATAVTGFDGGLGGYTASAAVNSVGWQASTKRSRTGSGSLYYGNPTKGDYDSGAANSGTATGPSVTLPAGQKAALHFWLYMDTETGAKFDVLKVLVNGTAAWVKDPSATMALSSYKKWVPVEIDLSSHAGSSVVITFQFDTMDGWENSSEGVYVDDVTIITKCGV